ncbi:MAG: hypothetical protein MJY74_08905, partial [Bacteroidaceae bacterium]|nr:hypothetical protein [Bacteroidaceae bacterium]
MKDVLGLEENADIFGVSYVYSGTSGYTYYCYTNKKYPKIVLNVNEDETASRITYPTRSDVTTTVDDANGATSAKYDAYTVKATTKYKTEYVDNGIGSKYSAAVYAGGKVLTGLDYYSAKTQLLLKPEFEKNVNGVIKEADDRAMAVYKIKSYDDTLEKNYANKTALSSSPDNSVKNIQDISNNETVTPNNNITIVVNYKPAGSFDVTGDQWTDHDKWLKQFHLYRTSGGAQNWEIHGVTVNDKDTSPINIYAIDDPQYGQANYCSFVYTFNAGATDVLGGRVNIDARDRENVNTESNLEIVRSAIDAARKASGKSAYDFIKDEYAKWSGINSGGSGLGFIAWPGSKSWSFNYYPASNSYTYVHLVDRWGNTVDKIIAVPNLDAIAANMKTASAGSVVISEDGGSGIATASLNANRIEIITDDNSTLDGNVYKTTGNTVKLYTGEPNKSYTLNVSDNATNASKATVKTDAEGYIVLTVEDTAYGYDGAYTFSLGNFQINLYDGVVKHI